MTERAGYGIRRDYKLLNWEQNEFPILCDNCMGESRYIRMLKKPLGAECKICTRPFSTFHWKPKSEVSRIRKTEICSTCAKINNCCQTCIYDLQYHLPIDVRNKLMGDKKVELLMSEGNRDIFAHLANENIDKLQLPYEEHEAMIRSKLLEQTAKIPENLNTLDYSKIEKNLNKTLSKGISDIKDLSANSLEAIDVHQREVQRQYEQAKKVVGTVHTLGSTWVGIKYIQASDEEMVRSKIGTFFDDLEFKLELIDNKAKIKFSKTQLAGKFMKILSENFVIKGKKLTVYWLDPEGNEEESDSKIYGMINDNLMPNLPPIPPFMPPVNNLANKIQKTMPLEMSRQIDSADNHQ